MSCCNLLKLAGAYLYTKASNFLSKHVFDIQDLIIVQKGRIKSILTRYYLWKYSSNLIYNKYYEHVSLIQITHLVNGRVCKFIIKLNNFPVSLEDIETMIEKHRCSNQDKRMRNFTLINLNNSTENLVQIFKPYCHVKQKKVKLRVANYSKIFEVSTYLNDILFLNKKYTTPDSSLYFEQIPDTCGNLNFEKYTKLKHLLE